MGDKAASNDASGKPSCPTLMRVTDFLYNGIPEMVLGLEDTLCWAAFVTTVLSELT